ncbi:MAG: hypothetical protein ACOVNU_09150 [Candidatus Kapaibacteriota bacterium]
MSKNNWIYIGIGVVAIGGYMLLLRNKKAKSKVTVNETNIAKRKGLVNMDVQFAAMSGEVYAQKTNLIPNVYGLYNKFGSDMNADGDGYFKTTNIQTACKCASKSKPIPSLISNFR